MNVTTALRAATGSLLALFATVAAAAPIVHTSDFIPDAQRTGFNGFEAAGFDAIYGQSLATYTEGDVRVAQVNEFITGYSPMVSTTYMSPGFDGQRSWYPGGGDYGYTSIKKADGAGFQSVGFLYGSGAASLDPSDLYIYTYFELWSNGARVMAGTLGPGNNSAKYLGFSGGGFDEIRIRDSLDWQVSGFGDGRLWLGGNNGSTYNGLAVDSIELAGTIPEPTGMVFTLIVVVAVFGRRALHRPSTRRPAVRT